MKTMTLSDLLDELRVAEQAMRKFEQRYWLSSDSFYELYRQGLLDDGNNIEEFAEWAGHYRLKQKREKALNDFSRSRINQLRESADGGTIKLAPQEPVVSIIT